MKLRFLLPGLLGLLGSGLLSLPVEAATLLGWQFDRDRGRLELTTDTAVQPRALLLSNPTRLVIDLPGILLRTSRQNQTIGSGIRSIRVGQFNQQTSRIVIELEPGYTLDPTQIQFRGSAANQWSVQLPPLQVSPAATADPSPAIADLPIAVPPPEVATLAPVPGAALPVQIPTPSSPLPQINNQQIVIVIDPGHGGPDPGAIGIGGLREVDVVMPISLQVAGLLRQQGVRVILTRETDVDLGLQPRVQLANRANATLFVSIHANAISMARPDVNGAETYHAGLGQELAASIHRQLLALGLRDRKVRRSRFYVLRNTRMPAALVEVGFVTGAEDAPRLADPDFRSRLAEAITRGILEYVQGMQ